MMNGIMNIYLFTQNTFYINFSSFILHFGLKLKYRYSKKYIIHKNIIRKINSNINIFSALTQRLQTN